MADNSKTGEISSQTRVAVPSGPILVALPADGQLVAGHFARAYFFVLAEVGPGQVCNVRFVAGPGREQGGPAHYLAGLGVQLVLAGNIGEQAKRVLADSGIRLQAGCTGPIERVLRDLAARMA